MQGTLNMKFMMRDYQYIVFDVGSYYHIFEMGKGLFHDFDLCRSRSVLQASDNDAEILLDLKHL